MPLDPATTNFYVPAILPTMPRIFRVPHSPGDSGTPEPGAARPEEGQLWPRLG